MNTMLHHPTLKTSPGRSQLQIPAEVTLVPREPSLTPPGRRTRTGSGRSIGLGVALAGPPARTSGGRPGPGRRNRLTAPLLWHLDLAPCLGEQRTGVGGRGVQEIDHPVGG